MTLFNPSFPARAIYPIADAAIKIDADPIRMLGWAIDGHIAVSAILPLFGFQGGQDSGAFEIAAEDVFGMFIEGGDTHAPIRRFRHPGEERWERITCPAEGFMLPRAGVIVTASELARFVSAHITPAALPQGAGPLRLPGRAGRPPSYDWDLFWGAVLRRVHERGIPATKHELVREMQEWFARNYADIPDMRTIRRRVEGMWPELMRGGEE
jgi:hypothetical protein